MPTNIGLDFGTTYSVISRIKENYDNNGNLISSEPEACLLSENAHTPNMDSIVVVDEDGSQLFGPLARDVAGRKGTTTFKGFKMLLAENDQQKLKERGYTKKHSPRSLTVDYLDNLLQAFLDMDRSVAKIDKVVVGVPEIWLSDISTIDCRATLEDAINEFPYVGEVELVSEPAAACAYFADNYKKLNGGALFQGRILLVDYGGGTLDIALCDVKQNSSRSEVTVIRRAGAGLNEEGFIGKAGMAFIEAVVKLALKPSGLNDSEIVQHRHFYRAVHSVETALMNRTQDIKTKFSRNKLGARAEISDKFCAFEFGDDVFNVSYGMLAEAYDNVIYPVLNEKLMEIISFMDASNINWRVNGDDNFKIAMVGGFCNFFLTQEQIEQTFKKSSNDKRFSGIVSDRRDCEKAISYGAALIANEITSFKQLAPYHLGIASGKKDDLKEIFYAIHKGNEIEYDVPVFIKDKFGNDILFAAKAIPMLAFSLDDNMEYAAWGEPSKSYAAKLSLKEGKYYKIGLSLDRSLRISIHKHIVDDPKYPDRVVDESSVRLNDDIYKFLGQFTAVRRVKK